MSVVGAGGAGGRVGAAIESLSFGRLLIFWRTGRHVGGAVGMEACGRWGRWV